MLLKIAYFYELACVKGYLCCCLRYVIQKGLSRALPYDTLLIDARAPMLNRALPGAQPAIDGHEGRCRRTCYKCGC